MCGVPLMYDRKWFYMFTLSTLSPTYVPLYMQMGRFEKARLLGFDFKAIFATKKGIFVVDPSANRKNTIAIIRKVPLPWSPPRRMSTLSSRLPRSLSASHDAWCLSIAMRYLWLPTQNLASTKLKLTTA
mmetsp:Transcript_5805/g.10562  ORF Transcript_5805/g.10562 Transcript_5805/m.10562 type:complete len:129 (+) Transcript_5805:180-566(+)